MSVESYGFKFVVDAKDAAKGYGDFQKAVDGVFASLAKFEAQAKKSIDSVTSSSKRGQSDVAKYANQFKALANIPIDSRAAPAMQKLSAAMAGFKAPNTTQVANLRSFFKALDTVPDLNGTTRSITAIRNLSAAMGNFKAPSSAQALRLVEFAKSLQQVGPSLASLKNVAGVSGIANELASISIALSRLKVPSAASITNLGNLGLALRQLKLSELEGSSHLASTLNAMSGFKAPTAAQARNLQQFITALNQLKMPANAKEISLYLEKVALAAGGANASLKNFRGSLNSVSWGNFNGGAHKARLEMMGLQNAFSGTFQAGSILRSLLGSLTIGELGHAFFQATQTANQFRAAMEVLGTTPAMGDQAWERVRADANHFGADLNQMAENFSKFSLAAHENGVGLQETFKIYEGFQTVMTATHMGTEQQQSVGLAIREMMDQGYVSTARLTRQLGLVLPGAVKTLGDAWKAAGNPGTIFDAMKKKMVDSTWALDVLSNHYKNVFGPAVKQALESPIQQFNILKNNIMQMMVEVGDAGAKKAFADLIKQISGYMDPSHAKNFAQVIGEGVTKAVNALSKAIAYLHDNWKTIGPLLGTTLKYMAEWEILMSSLKIGQWMTSPILGLVRALGMLRGVGTVFTVLGAAMPVATGAAGKLGGAMGVAANGVLNLRKTMLAFNVAASLSAAASTGLVSKLGALATVTGGALATGLRGIVNLIGGPIIANFLAWGYVAKKLYDIYQAGQVVISDSNQYLQDSNKTVKEAIDKLYLHADASMAATAKTLDFNDCTRTASPFLDQMTIKLDKATGGLWSMATAARAAALETLKLEQTKAGQALAGMQVNSAAETGNLSNQLWKKGRYTQAVGAGIYSSVNSLQSAIGWQDSQKDIDAQVGKLRGHYKDIAKQIEDITNTPIDKIVKGMQGAGLGAPDKTDSHYHGVDGDGKKGRKKHGPTERQLAERNQNADSSLMSDLMKYDDQSTKLYSDFVKTLTKEGQFLLNDKSFKGFINNMKTDAHSGQVSVDSLIAALQNGGIKGKVLDDLKKRYHTDVAGIITMLKEQQKDYEAKLTDIAVKDIQNKTKDFKAAMQEINKDNPVAKLMDDFTTGLEESASKLLNGKAYIAWYQETEESANGAATAVERLVAAINAGALKDDVLKALKATGGSVGSLAGRIQHSGAINAQEIKDKEKELNVTASLNEQYAKEGAFLLMSNRQTDVANKLLETFNAQKALKHDMGQAEIDQAKIQIEQGEKQIEILRQQKAYYENNGLKSYVRDVETAGDFVHKFDANVLHGLEDTLYKLGTTGKLSFKDLINGMQSDIIRFASQNLVKTFAEKLGGGADSGKGDPTMFGFLGKMLGGTTGFTAKRDGSNPMGALYVEVTNGALAFGVGGKDTLGQTAAGVGNTSKGGVVDMLGLGDTNPDKPGSVGYSVKGGISDGVGAAAPGITNTFNSMFKDIAPSLGMMLAGAVGGAVGGTKGAIISGIAEIGIAFLTHGGGGGAAPVPGHKEGGITGHAVSSYMVSPAMFRNAPHYAEGTANTSDGGHPAILHDNEAVIPLSRGRKVAVELTGGGSRATTPVINNNFTVNSPDADSFRKSKSQIATELHMMGARSWQRNNS